MGQDEAFWSQVAAAGTEVRRDGPEMEPKWAKMGPRWGQDGPRRAYVGSYFAYVARELHFPKNGVSPRRERHFGAPEGRDEAEMELCWDPGGLSWGWFGATLAHVGLC